MTRLLLVDDEKYLLEGMQMILEDAGYQVWAVETGEAAWQIMQDNRNAPPAMVVTDMMMPGMNGMELLTLVRAETAWTDLPFLFISATSTEDMEQQIAGVTRTEFLRKPFEIDNLLATIARFVEKQ